MGVEGRERLSSLGTKEKKKFPTNFKKAVGAGGVTITNKEKEAPTIYSNKQTKKVSFGESEP